jgi:hypothetical protein
MSSWGFIRDGKLRTFFLRHGEEMSTPVFMRGPMHAKCIVEDFSPTRRLEDAGAGFLLDFDTMRAWVWDSQVAWTAEAYDAAFDFPDEEYNEYVRTSGAPADADPDALYEAARKARKCRLGTAHLADAVLAQDLYPEERVLADVARAGTDPAAFFKALREVPLKHSYRDWELTWVANAAAVRGALEAK